MEFSIHPLMSAVFWTQWVGDLLTCLFLFWLKKYEDDLVGAMLITAIMQYKVTNDSIFNFV